MAANQKMPIKEVIIIVPAVVANFDLFSSYLLDQHLLLSFLQFILLL